MSVPKAQATPVSNVQLMLEVVQLRAQVRELSVLLTECGILDASMVNGRMQHAASRALRDKRGSGPRAAQQKQGFWARLFRRNKPEPFVPMRLKDSREITGPIATGKLADQTVPVVELPFNDSILYGEPDLSNTTERRSLTPTEIGKCERCWRMRPLASDHLCFRCSSSPSSR
jgi:hypothetical protein